MNITILIQLLLAHILTDFVLQTDGWVKKKNQKGIGSFYFWGHGLLSGLLAYIFIQQWTNWWIPLFISITHLLIDLGKIKYEEKAPKKYRVYSFVVDQLLHILIIIVAWLIIVNGFNQVPNFIKYLTSDLASVSIITAVIMLIWPVGIVIGKLTEPFRKEIKADDSLKKAGHYIGIFERLLVFVFIIIGQYAAIGFLIASKSILRITRDNDEEGRKKTEYVLIGTMISFTIAILIGLMVRLTLK